MPTNMKPWDAAPAPIPRKTSSTAKLLQAAALAAVLVPLGSVALEAGPITCGFSGYASIEANKGGEGCTNAFGDTNRFNWGDYFFELQFEGMNPLANFDVTITDVPMTQGDFGTRSTAFPGYECITLVDPSGPLAADGPCRDFVIDAPTVPEWSSYLVKIFWNFDTNGAFPNGFDEPGPVPGQVRVLQNPSAVPGNAFTIDMCLTFPVPGCEYFPAPVPGDPGIRSGDTVFSSMTPAWTPAAAVPEPSSLILLATGASGFLYRRCRRRQKPEAAPTA